MLMNQVALIRTIYANVCMNMFVKKVPNGFFLLDSLLPSSVVCYLISNHCFGVTISSFPVKEWWFVPSIRHIP